MKKNKTQTAKTILANEKDFATRQSSSRKSREEIESERVLALEAENRRLKSELDDTLETVEIFKQVISDYTTKLK